MELVQGTLDILVLKTLCAGPRHGYDVAEAIHRSSRNALKIEEGALYPALHRLERRGLLSSGWGLSENNRRARFYSLTTKGQKALKEETAEWLKYVAAVMAVLEPA